MSADWLSPSFWAVLWLAWLIASGWAVIHILLRRPDPYSAWAWLVLCALVPLGGAAWYWLFGINRVRTRARKRGPLRRPRAASGREPLQDARQGCAPDHPALSEALSEVARTGDALTGRPLLAGNALELLFDGEQAYPRMLAAIDSATRWIALEIYIFDTDTTGQRFIDALARAKDRGVEVRCLLDGVGEFAWRRAGSALIERGLKVERFNPIRFWPPFLHINLRNHRKLLLVDGRIGFAGGMNLSATHLAQDVANLRRVSDVQVQLQGPILTQLAEMFRDDWRYASGVDWAPTPPGTGSVDTPDGSAVCRLITDGPNEDFGQLSLVLHSAIASAQRRILVITPYFLPPPELSAALIGAAVRGIAVDVILPAASDQPVTDCAARRNFSVLMSRGVRIHYQPAPFCHAKLFVVDEAYAQFGSANFDTRSLSLNFELMVEVYDRPFVQALAAHCERLLSLSAQVTPLKLRLRSLPGRLRDAVCWLFSPYL